MLKKILIPSLILFFVSVLAFADDTSLDTPRSMTIPRVATLRDLKGVYIVIGDLFPSLKKHGLTTEQIQTDVEVKLRTAGIRIIPTEKEWSKEAGMPTLFINISPYYHRQLKAFTLFTHIELMQAVQLTRNPTEVIGATTWETGHIRMVRENNIREILDAINDEVDEFMSAYLTANPKK